MSIKMCDSQKKITNNKESIKRMS